MTCVGSRAWRHSPGAWYRTRCGRRRARCCRTGARGRRAAADARAVLVAVVYVVTSGCAWQHLPPSFGVSVPTAHRWFTRWTGADLWRNLCEATSHDPALADWTRAIQECAARRVHT
ncbi:transposase [Streptomyces sp. NRRL F-5053]|uniref:transposase n=1 Tax=Streptomyces sp. NRRL F-5053 TaxID=1463854 RepID=UPI00099E0D24|nr:transposase [Streptomyces sp. NRRL F-5053]